ncbi:MAG: hypothetical protein GY768_29335 [Planctomycetaceae bacterium]|nr:hypothetical protein [Planctomycetaceae bacterium]
MLELEYNPAVSPELGDKEGIDHIMDVTESKRSSGLLPHHPTLKGLVSRTVQILNMKQRLRNTPRFQTKDAVFKTNLHLTMDGEKRKLPPPVLTPLFTTMFPEAVREFVRESLELRDEIQKIENDAVKRARDWKAGKFNTGVWANPEPLLPPVIEVGSVKLTASPAALKEESEGMDLSAGLTVDAVMADGGGLAAKTGSTADDQMAEGGGLAAATDTAVENVLQGAVDVGGKVGWLRHSTGEVLKFDPNIPEDVAEARSIYDKDIFEVGKLSRRDHFLLWMRYQKNQVFLWSKRDYQSDDIPFIDIWLNHCRRIWPIAFGVMVLTDDMKGLDPWEVTENIRKYVDDSSRPQLKLPEGIFEYDLELAQTYAFWLYSSCRIDNRAPNWRELQGLDSKDSPESWMRGADDVFQHLIKDSGLGLAPEYQEFLDIELADGLTMYKLKRGLEEIPGTGIQRDNSTSGHRGVPVLIAKGKFHEEMTVLELDDAYYQAPGDPPNVYVKDPKQKGDGLVTKPQEEGSYAEQVYIEWSKWEDRSWSWYDHSSWEDMPSKFQRSSEVSSRWKEAPSIGRMIDESMRPARRLVERLKAHFGASGLVLDDSMAPKHDRRENLPEISDFLLECSPEKHPLGWEWTRGDVTMHIDVLMTACAVTLPNVVGNERITKLESVPETEGFSAKDNVVYPHREEVLEPVLV